MDTTQTGQDLRGQEAARMKTVLYARVSTLDQTLEHTSRPKPRRRAIVLTRWWSIMAYRASGRLYVTAQKDEGCSTCCGQATLS